MRGMLAIGVIYIVLVPYAGYALALTALIRCDDLLPGPALQD
jgi:hypothetical protein